MSREGLAVRAGSLSASRNAEPADTGELSGKNVVADLLRLEISGASVQVCAEPSYISDREGLM